MTRSIHSYGTLCRVRIRARMSVGRRRKKRAAGVILVGEILLLSSLLSSLPIIADENLVISPLLVVRVSIAANEHERQPFKNEEDTASSSIVVAVAVPRRQRPIEETRSRRIRSTVVGRRRRSLWRCKNGPQPPNNESPSFISQYCQGQGGAYNKGGRRCIENQQRRQRRPATSCATTRRTATTPPGATQSVATFRSSSSLVRPR
jgi:hypothetical protein